MTDTAWRTEPAVSAPPPERPSRRKVSTAPMARRRRRREMWAAYAFLAPWFVGLAVITAGPLFTSLYLSFTDYSLLSSDTTWVGLDNYTRMLNDDPRYMKALTNTAIYVFVSVPLQLTFALALALLLDRGVSGLPIYRSIYYLPSLLGSSVAIAILWRQIFGADGIVNDFLGLFGVEGTSWVADPDTALGTLIVLNVWTFGSPMVIFLAGLRQIPRSYYEAAEIDGANKRRQFLSITLPLLTPIIFFNLVLQLINAFQSFTQAFVVSGGKGSPADSTLFYTMYIYMKGFGPSLEMGYASAMAWVLVLIIATLTAANFLMSKYWVFYSDK